VEIKKIDYDDQSTLVAALQGQDALIITLAVTALDQHAKLVEAAAAAGVPWILPNELGYDTNDDQLNQEFLVGIGKKKDREHIEKLGKSSWIGIACGFWYEYSLSAGPWSYGFDLQNRAVTFFDEGTKVSTSTWLQTGRAVANLLALKVLPDEANDSSPCLSRYRNKFVYVSSFTINQQDMFDSVLRVTKTTRGDWNISSQPVRQRYAEGKERFQNGDRTGYGMMLYARAFFPDEAGQHPSNNNGDLGLPEEDLDECTKSAVQMAEDGYFERFVASRGRPSTSR
jgi:hypothetical protein